MVYTSLKVIQLTKGFYHEPSMSVIAFLPVLFYKNVFVFLDQVVFYKNVLSYFIKAYLNVSTLKYAYKNIFHF